MARSVPPLEAIEAFLAVARCGGVRAAALELNVSASSISRRVGRLEGSLGRQLFDRADGGLRLTTAGRRYQDLVSPAIAAIDRAGNRLADGEERIVVAASHSLASRWLMPRLPALRGKAGLQVEILPTRDPDVVRSGEAHFGIWGSLEAPDLHTETLVSTSCFPVRRRCRADEGAAASSLEALASMPLLGVKQPHGLWRRWFAAAGLRCEPQDVTEFATLALMYEAAEVGLGVALAVPMLCEPQLADGTLRPCGPRMALGESYRLFRNRGRRGSMPAESAFVGWLRAEVARSSALFDAVAGG